MAKFFAKAKVIEEETNVAANAAQVKMDAAMKEFRVILPAMEAAESAVDSLTVRNIAEFSSFA